MGWGPQGLEGKNGSGAHLHQTLVNPLPHGPYARFTPSLSASQRQERRAPVVCPALNCPALPRLFPFLSSPRLPCFLRFHPPFLASFSLFISFSFPFLSPPFLSPFTLFPSLHPPFPLPSSYSSLVNQFTFLYPSLNTSHSRPLSVCRCVRTINSI